jgi:hypothetical protein
MKIANAKILIICIAIILCVLFIGLSLHTLIANYANSGQITNSSSTNTPASTFILTPTPSQTTEILVTVYGTVNPQPQGLPYSIDISDLNNGKSYWLELNPENGQFTISLPNKMTYNVTGHIIIPNEHWWELEIKSIDVDLGTFTIDTSESSIVRTFG